MVSLLGRNPFVNQVNVDKQIWSFDRPAKGRSRNPFVNQVNVDEDKPTQIALTLSPS